MFPDYEERIPCQTGISQQKGSYYGTFHHLLHRMDPLSHSYTDMLEFVS